MDPTLFLANQPEPGRARHKDSAQEIDAFYAECGADAFATFARLKQRLQAAFRHIGARPTRQPRFAQSPKRT